MEKQLFSDSLGTNVKMDQFKNCFIFKDEEIQQSSVAQTAK